MKVQLNWQEAMVFEAESEGNKVLLDAKSPIGKGSAPTPKELVAMGLGGCTSMDVIALLKKYKQLPKSFYVEVEVVQSQGKTPAVFESAEILYVAEGDVDAAKLIEAVQLSQTKYCGVTAMLSKAFPVTYRIQLNGVEIGDGQAHF